MAAPASVGIILGYVAASGLTVEGQNFNNGAIVPHRITQPQSRSAGSSDAREKHLPGIPRQRLLGA
jgi:hypothetical protein